MLFISWSMEFNRSVSIDTCPLFLKYDPVKQMDKPQIMRIGIYGLQNSILLYNH